MGANRWNFRSVLNNPFDFIGFAGAFDACVFCIGFLDLVFFIVMKGLFHKDKIYGQHDEYEGQHMIPVQLLSLEHNVGNNGKDEE